MFCRLQCTLTTLYAYKETLQQTMPTRVIIHSREFPTGRAKALVNVFVEQTRSRLKHSVGLLARCLKPRARGARNTFAEIK